VNFETGRVRPAWTFDLSSGWRLAKLRGGELQLQADVRNLTDTLRVINFSGVFSGTALAAPRTFAVRVRWGF
jgi:outer membrane receptor protein involved in Fe transport